MNNVDYEKDNIEKANKTTANVMYDVHDNHQMYQNKKCTKGVEKHCCTKYRTGCGGSRSRSKSRSTVSKRIASPSIKSNRSQSASKMRKMSDSQKSHSQSRASQKSRRSSGSRTNGNDQSRNKVGKSKSKSPMSKKVKSSKSSIMERSAKCYEVKRGKKRQTCIEPVWQHGKYVKDECGSGILPMRYNFRPSRKIWCKTPLSMYQATIGELARKLLCREKVVPRDVKPAPPCNIEQYILPFCRGYYRKYDCLRPCEEEYAYYKGGKKHYRDCVERYWEPCLTKEQKIKLDINEYAPQNAYLAKKMLRMKEGDHMKLPCW
ncbi:hypothetical protein PGB90_006185 [Kerria lacca]